MHLAEGSAYHFIVSAPTRITEGMIGERNGFDIFALKNPSCLDNINILYCFHWSHLITSEGQTSHSNDLKELS